MKYNMAPTLSPEEAIRLGVMRPISEQDNLEPIVREYMKYAETTYFGPATFILTLLQIAYNAGRIEGIRVERSRKNRGGK